MKIEKISDNQIRCILTKEDLAMRHLKISELAYGNEKTKALFREMMQQAASEFGFEANDIPLMIEAIPLPSDTVIMIITKVEDPEELDTRFAKFAPSDGSDMAEGSSLPFSAPIEGADSILDLIGKLREARKAIAEKKKEAASEEIPLTLTKLFRFRSLDTVIQVAAVLENVCRSENSLYKDEGSSEYHLLVSQSDHTPEEFNKICNILSEYGSSQKFAPGMDAFYAEHMTCMISGCALQKLASLAS